MTPLSLPLLSDEGKAPLTDPHSLRDYQHSQAAPGLRGGGCSGGRVGSRRGKELGGGGMDMNSTLTNTHRMRLPKQSTLHPPPRLVAG